MGTSVLMTPVFPERPHGLCPNILSNLPPQGTSIAVPVPLSCLSVPHPFPGLAADFSIPVSVSPRALP